VWWRLIKAGLDERQDLKNGESVINNPKYKVPVRRVV